jgi:hypothetical protein
MASRNSPADGRTQQERRVSARRGWTKSHPHTRPLFVGGPPSVGVRIALAFAFLGATGGLRPPLLYCVRMFAGETAACAMHERGFTRAAGVSPPWVGKIASAYTTAIPRRTADGVCADCRCIRVSRRHGGLTPPALGGSAVRRFPGETATCAVHKRWFPRAAGVSPPWHKNRTGNGARVLPDVDARMPRGAYAPRSWWFCSAEICRRNCDFSDARTLVYKSGGRQPAVGTKRTGNGAHFFPEGVHSRTTAGLRQPLLVHGIGRPKNNDTRGAQTHVLHERRVSARRGNGVEPSMASRNSPADGRTQQERRASARRGNETHLQWRAFFSGREYVRLPRLAYASRSWLQHVRMSLQICAS